MANFIGSKILSSKFFKPSNVSTLQKALLIPYFGLGAVVNPKRGDFVAGLGDITAESALKQLHFQMLSTPEGRILLTNKPIITEENININKLKTLDSTTFGKQYMNFMEFHEFSANERMKVRFLKESDSELAYIMLRYRQIHDFLHILCDLPPTILGEIALKWFEYRMTGLPICLLSGMIGPLKLLSPKEQYILYHTYLPWAWENGDKAKNMNLISYYYENSFEETIEEMRNKLNIQIAPKINI